MYYVVGGVVAMFVIALFFSLFFGSHAGPARH